MTDFLVDHKGWPPPVPPGPPGRERAIASAAAMQVVTVLGIAVLLTFGGLVTDVWLLTALGGATGAGVAIWTVVTAPEWVILAFVLIRPMLDLAPSYERGPSMNAPAGALLMVAMISWVVKHRARLRRPSPSVLTAAALAGAALLSAAGSYDPRTSLELAMRIVSVAALFFVAEQWSQQDPRALQRIIVAVVGSAFLACSVAAAQIVGIVGLPGIDPIALSLDPQLARPPGPYPAPTVLAAHLMIALSLLLVAVPRIWRSARWRVMVLYAIGFAGMCLWVLSENKSRSPILALIAVVATFTSVRWRWLGALASVMIALAAVATLQTSTIRLDELGSGADSGANADTFEWRTNYWRDNLPRFTESPITGIGLGRIEQLHAFRQPPHNTVVQAIVEMGIVGALAYLAFALLLARDLAISIRRARGTPLSDVMILVSLLCVGYALIGLVENLLTQLVTSGPVALATGAALGSVQALGRER